MVNLNYIDFLSDELDDLVVNSVLEEFYALGGSELAIQCVNFENSVISFETSDILRLFNLSDIVVCMRANSIDSFEVIKDNYTLVGCSFDGGREWALGIARSSELIKNTLESLWYSVFES